MSTLGDLIMAGLIIAAVAIVPYKIARAWLWPFIKPMMSVLFTGPGVKDYQDRAPKIMSREMINDAPSLPSSLETDTRQTPDRPTMPVPTRAEILDIFRVLRKAGVAREALRGPWRAAGLTLDNNLWTEAAPPEDEYTTPIAGRPTRAQFDADYPYQPPPN